MQTRIIILAVAVLLLAVGGAMADSFGTDGNQFAIDFVPISGATNPTSGQGIVNNDYRIGKFEITNDQWTKFKSSLGVPVTGSELYAYDQTPAWTGLDVPTNCVSWYEAAQFVNWLNTSTGHHAAYKFGGTQGTSGYTLTTWSSAEADNGTNLYRHKDAFYYLPTYDEWGKAAYWNGTNLQTYANAWAGDLVSGLPDPAGWNFSGSEPWIVGSGRQELNGTYDMMGNVWEWMESPYSSQDYRPGSGRWMRGGSYYYYDGSLASSFMNSDNPYNEYGGLGFRVAAEVPEPATLSLLALGGLAILRRRKPA